MPAMASQSQIEANRRNAQSSTGPRTPAGQATVARNGVSHGLSANKFALLPWEDPAEFDELLNGLIAEHQPSTPTEEFLVRDMARAQWKLSRVAHLEHELLAGEDGASDWAELADKWSSDCTYNQKLQKLERYETSLRRAWYLALNTLTKLRGPVQRVPKPAEPEIREIDKAKPIGNAPSQRETPHIERRGTSPEPIRADQAAIDRPMHEYTELN